MDDITKTIKTDKADDKVDIKTLSSNIYNSLNDILKKDVGTTFTVEKLNTYAKHAIATVFGTLKSNNLLKDNVIATEQVDTKKGHRAPNKKNIAPDHVNDFVRWFVTSPLTDLYAVSRGQYQSIKEDNRFKLLFHSKYTSWRSRNTKEKNENILALRYLNDSPALVSSDNSFSYYGGGWRGARPQIAAMEAGGLPVPFSVIVDAKEGLGKSIDDVTAVSWDPQEKLNIIGRNQVRWDSGMDYIERHFAGATVFKIGEKYYLIDADREDLKVGVFNAFFVELPNTGIKNPTVKQAYESLFPNALKGVTNYIRQGELFFKPMDKNEIEKLILSSGKGKRKISAAKDKHNYDIIMKLTDGIAIHDYNETVRQLTSETKSTGKVTKEMEVIIARRTKLLPNEIKRDDNGWGAPGEDELEKRLDGTSAHFNLEHDVAIPLATGRRNNRQQTFNHQTTLLFKLKAADKTRIFSAGTVTHSGHYTLYMPGWHEVFVSKGTNSWDISGRID
ncbi:hypothetical protein ACFLQL_01625 [Verrucomicrobiota bacterium]